MDKEKLIELFDAQNWDELLNLIIKLKTGATKTLFGLKRNCFNVIELEASRWYSDIDEVFKNLGFHIINCNLQEFKKMVKKGEINLDTHKDIIISTTSHSINSILNEKNLPNNRLKLHCKNNSVEYYTNFDYTNNISTIEHKEWWILENLITGEKYEFDKVSALGHSRDERIDSIFED